MDAQYQYFVEGQTAIASFFTTNKIICKMSESKSSFRVVVIGAGVTGLVASHCLYRAGIDHIVLEKRENVAPPEGASIAMYPHGTRVLHQLGCLKAVEEACVPTKRWWHRGPDGKNLMDNGFFLHLEDNFNYNYILLERRKFLEILYDTLPDKSRIRTGCQVADVEHVADGVKVTLSNGEVEAGDIVFGCDGTYSNVRSMMWEYANKMTPGLITTKEKTSYLTEWKAVVGVAPAMPGGLGDRDMVSVSDKGRTFISFSQPDYIYFFFIFQLDEPFRFPKRANPNDPTAEELAETVLDHPVSESMVFGELWKKRLRGDLIYLEDGIMEHWHAGRIVLVGDAVHKTTPNMGFGGNCGIEDVAVLCNNLNRLLLSCKGRKPSTVELGQAFEAYKTQRMPAVKKVAELCRLVTKVQVWQSPWYKFVDTWVFPLQADKAISNQVSEIIRAGAKLDYVDDSGCFSGSMPWIDEKETGSARTLVSSSIVLGVAAVFMLAFQGVRFNTILPTSITG
ncbi:uncharacterized protein F4822DRAFT_407438 [Hypoxylon trugodes]|uniref:uncharacterized protein n=1 Tax=Hypoxylon trugodes TaxID=326681 RepID=UPI0021A043F4|nr:uncharacterized protein F4822DRAFT_407438 [Hypoxylon trugodes]KAI1387729.1 hypothetical protein F4822DRAFT_407438 [Hypoxylon trugodes]